MYGTEMLEWDPLTTELQLKDDLKVDVLDRSLNKLQAAASIVTSNLFHKSLETFTVTCSTLSQGITIPSEFVPAGLNDCAWGVTEANLLEGNEFWSQGFDENIALYVGLLLDQSGIYTAPKMLAFALYPNGVQERNYESFEGNELEFRVFWEKQQENKAIVEGYAKNRMRELLTELSALPIKGANREFLGKILENLKG
jgi:hypothetical protein